MRRLRTSRGLAALTLALGCLLALPAPASADPRRCVNLSSDLQAAIPGAWNYVIAPGDFARLRADGFDGVRLLVSWDRNAGRAPPYRIAPAFLDRVAAAVDAALAAGLEVQLNYHDADAIHDAPLRELPRFRATWRQIAARFADHPAQLSFELLNEPHGALTPRVLEQVYAAALAEVRATNPTRRVWLNGPGWSNLPTFEDWAPPADPHVGVSAHYYEPFALTHHKDGIFGPGTPVYDGTWGAPADHAAVRADIAAIAAWGRARGVAMQVGEFGVIPTRPAPERLAWVGAVRTAAEAEGMSWCVFDFAAGFELTAPRGGPWLPGTRRALGLE